jgi:citronellyl-CoA dehydrogenase
VTPRPAPAVAPVASAARDPDVPARPAAHTAFRHRVRALLAERVVPRLDAWEAAGALPREIFRELGDAGLLGLGVAPRWGGQGYGLWHDVVLVEELAAAGASGLAASVLSQAAVCTPLIERHGSAQQREALLRPLVTGERIAAIAATEPGVGSDLTNLTCHATDDGGAWVIDGEKRYITNGPLADLLLLLARRDERRSPLGFVLLLVPADTAGCTRGAPLRTLGLRSSPLGGFRFTRCRVPKDLTLGDPRGGFLYAARQLMVERLLASVGAVALAATVLQRTVEHVRRRRAYGGPLTALQVVRHTLVDQATAVETLRRCARSLCATAAEGTLVEREICMLKIRAAELVQQVTEACLQLHGAAGFLDDHWLARVYRDSRAFGLAGGSTAMLKDLLAGYLRL